MTYTLSFPFVQCDIYGEPICHYRKDRWGGALVNTVVVIVGQFFYIHVLIVFFPTTM